MNWLSAAERLAAFDRSQVQFNQQNCLHSSHREADCEACFAICPTGAIQAGSPPRLNAEQCEGCLACLTICPQGAFRGQASSAALLTSAARSETRQLEVLCEHHPHPEQGRADGLGIQVHGCLAGLGAGSLLALLCLGFDQVEIRGDACAACAWSSLGSLLQKQVQQAQRFQPALPEAVGKLLWVEDCPAESRRTLWDAHNPPLSRRDLFRLASRQGAVTAARALSQDHTQEQVHLNSDRVRMNAALKQLELDANSSSLSLAGMGFGSVQVNSDCTACGVCARICPTGALRLKRTEESFALFLDPTYCTACGLCPSTCASGSIQLDAAPTVAQVFSGEQQLAAGPLKRCESCSTLFAAPNDEKLCPACAFRRKNPFGQYMPPGLRPGNKPKKVLS